VSNGGDAVRLERTFQADIDRVFRAFTDPGELVHWWGPMDVRTSVAQIDLRVGGECRWVMHPSGQVAVLHGRIVDLDPARLLVMTNRWDRQDEESLRQLRLCSLRRTTASTPSSSTPLATAARTSRSLTISSSGTDNWSPARSSSTAPLSWHSWQVEHLPWER
jgi:uncharacterized protein YndB with AHSA1/START domain